MPDMLCFFCIIYFIIHPSLQRASDWTLSVDDIPMIRPTCHIILIHWPDCFPLSTFGAQHLTILILPTADLIRCQRSFSKVTSHLSLSDMVGSGRLSGAFCSNTPDGLKSVTASVRSCCVASPTAPVRSLAVITQLHAPGHQAADWSLSDGWQEKLSEGIKYSHTAR